MKTCKVKKVVFSSILLGSLLYPLSALIAQVSSLFVQDYPQSYIVQDDDTIDDIASIFLVNPDNWDSVWSPSPGRSAADINPGDIIEVDFIDGSPKIVSKTGALAVQRLSPQMREIASLGSIPEIPLESIVSSFTNNRIVTETVYNEAPYIVSPTGSKLVIGANDEFFARGTWPQGVESFTVYRRLNAFDDPDGEDSLGIELETVGTASIIGNEENELKRLTITNSKREILTGDRLLFRDDMRLDPIIYPSDPDSSVAGNIIAMTNTERMASQLDTVLVNVGARENLTVGSILAIHQPGPLIVDTTSREKKGFFGRIGSVVSGERVEMPSREIGTLMIYRVFDRMSYGLILSSTEPAKTGDKVLAP